MESRPVSDEELKRVTEQAFLAALVRGAISHLRSGVVAREAGREAKIEEPPAAA